MYRIWFERALLPRLAYLLDGVAEPIGPASATPDDPLSAVSQAEGIVASQFVYDGAFMDQAPKLKIISRTGIGYEKVDVAAATERGIAVCNTPDGPTISTAEHTVMLMLAAAKNMKQGERKLRGGGQTDYYVTHEGIELYHATLGLVGFGRIARHVAGIAQAFQMAVLTYDPFIAPQAAAERGVEAVDSLEMLLQQADVVSLHVPLTEATRHLMNAERFAQMKPGAVFINAARGGLVDEAALLAALDSHHLFAAGLDVTDPEPADPANPLLQREDVIVTPHVASATRAGKNRINEMAIRQVIQALQGQRPLHLVNPEVWPQ
ncbi:MAG: hydroxyacid dehydrogenase [Anaerolineae bacterium]|nr:hydroxyacid dehydrogenase [Anaerolineae bacterium]